MKRAAFSLIELVLAIVIIAISVMTIPLMLSQSGNNNAFAITQESILAARTKMGNILTYEWDRNSTENNASSITYIRVLDVQNGDVELRRSNTYDTDTNRRVGHVISSYRRRFHDGNMTEAFMTFPFSAVNDTNFTNINDFHGKTENFTSLSNDLDYVREFNMTTSVSYISDETDYTLQTVRFDFNVSSSADIENVNLSTNIKMIELEVQSEDGQPFTFRTFSSNIGQTDLLKREVD